jgi:hypothetical protein
MHDKHACRHNKGKSGMQVRQASQAFKASRQQKIGKAASKARHQARQGSKQGRRQGRGQGKAGQQASRMQGRGQGKARQGKAGKPWGKGRRQGCYMMLQECFWMLQ